MIVIDRELYGIPTGAASNEHECSTDADWNSGGAKCVKYSK